MLTNDTRPSTFGRTLHLRNQWLNALPQRTGDLFATCHALILPLANNIQGVLLAALSEQH
ncbi:hypothetical protein XACS582_14550002 [Xanthomonas citri pv. citri]|nr:hypothetical protein XACLD7_15360007 [Xanthomonas citri pv. citri]CEH61446.1 hypothetical protein XACS582_14550002 [Xanthomonas citri pv. citri]